MLIHLLPLLFLSTVTARLLPHSLHARQTTDPTIVGPTGLSPLQDPFYSPPASVNLAGLKRGDIIQSRRIFVNASQIAIESAYQLLFRSESQNGTALAALTTIWVPKIRTTDRFVLTARYVNSNSRRCAVSWRYTNGSLDDLNFITKGWIVSSADHEGPDAANGAGRLQGRILLDAGRATLNFATLGLLRNSKIVINGYSGGATAAGWATTLAATYAPDLNIVGATFGGTPADGIKTLEAIDGGLFAGLTAMGVFGQAKAYSALDKRIEQILTPKGKELREKASSLCGAAAYQSLAFTKFLSTDIQTLGADLVKDSILKPIADSLVLGGVASETPKIPIYMYHGLIDEIIPEYTVTSTVQNWCKNGANLVYQKIYFAEHFIGFANVNVVPFIVARFNGVSFPNGCRYADIAFSFQPSNTSTDGFRQLVFPSRTVQKQIDDKRAQDQQRVNKAQGADPATQKRILESRLPPAVGGGAF